MSDFEVKDSGARLEFDSGMRRDGEDGKLDYTLALDGPMHKRYVIHMTKGAVKYGHGNWLNANSQEEYERFRRSAYRNLLQWLAGERDEDHAAAVMFNLIAAEYVMESFGENAPPEYTPPTMSSVPADQIGRASCRERV